MLLFASVATASAHAAERELVPLGQWGTGEQVGPHAEAIAVGADGTLAVADRSRDRVVLFGPDRTPAGGFTADDPRGIAAVPGGYLVAEPGGVRRVSAAGATLGEYAADDPHGVALSGDTVLIATRGKIRRYTLGGTALQSWPAWLADPRGLAVAADGSVYVADRLRWRIERFSAAGEPAGGWWTPDPHGVAVAPDGTVFAASSRTHRLAWFSPAGDRLGELRLTHPRGVAADCRGTVTVAGSAAQRLSAYGDAGAAPPPCTPPVVPPQPARPAPPLAAPPLAVEQPQLGRTAAATPVSGTVLVAGRPLKNRTIVPVTTEIDTTDGRVELVFETTTGGFQEGTFSAGSFTFHQGRDRSLVELRLTGEAPAADVDRGARTSAKRKRRRVWGRGSGDFRTTGRHGSATVRGTRWLTEDRATGTFIRVVEGSVLAQAFDRDVRRIVNAGESFLAKPACVSRRAFRIRLRVPVGTAVRSARVLVAGRRVKVIRGARITAPVDLRGLPRGTVNVRIRVVTRSGAVLRETRTYRTCLGARG
jgi:DNA-binding beta-propeller fold protein YncE